MVTVTVIITTCNSEKSIQRLLDSIRGQVGLDKEFLLELIVADDCSVDSTREILARNNIEYLSTPSRSGGPNKGRNMGLQRASGDFICIADHDDEWEKNKIITQLGLTGLAPVVTSGYTLVNDTNGKRSVRNNPPVDDKEYNLYEENETFLKRLTKSKNAQQTYIGSIMFSAALKDILFEEHFGMVDFDWVLRLFHGRDSAESCLPLYIRHETSENLSLDPQYRAIDFYYSLMTIEGYAPRYPHHVNRAEKRIHGSRARYLYLTGRMRDARRHFARSELNLKTLLFYLTTFAGSGFVKNHFRIFG